MVAKLIPHPLLTITIAVVWTLLANELSWAAAIMGGALGIAVPLVTRSYWPDKPRIRSPRVIFEYILIVLWDIVVSNVQVAYLILFRRGRTLRSQFIAVPLDLTTAEAIGVLAGTITMTPGTVTADVSADGRALLVHCLEINDVNETVARIKRRYESRLLRIFA